MKDLYLKNNREYDHFVSYLGEPYSIGKDGVCYIYKGYFLKSLEGIDYHDNESQLDIERLQQFSRIDIDTYIFAKNFVYVSNEIRALIMRYIPFPQISEVNLNELSFEVLEKALSTLEKETLLVSQLGIEVVDQYESNILFGNDKFYLVDTLDYSFLGMESQELFKNNLSHIMMNIYAVLFNKNIRRFINNTPELKNYLLDKELLSNPTYFLTQLKIYLSEHCGRNIPSIISASQQIGKRKNLIIPNH